MSAAAATPWLLPAFSLDFPTLLYSLCRPKTVSLLINDVYSIQRGILHHQLLVSSWILILHSLPFLHFQVSNKIDESYTASLLASLWSLLLFHLRFIKVQWGNRNCIYFQCIVIHMCCRESEFFCFIPPTQLVCNRSEWAACHPSYLASLPLK